MGKQLSVSVWDVVLFFTVMHVAVASVSYITDSKRRFPTLVSDCQPTNCSQLEQRQYGDLEFHCRIWHKAGAEDYKKDLNSEWGKLNISVPLLKKVDVCARRKRQQNMYYVLNVAFIIPFSLDNDMKAVSLELIDKKKKTETVVRLFNFSTYRSTGLDMKTPRLLNYCFVVNPSGVYFLRFTLIPSGHQLGYYITTDDPESSQWKTPVAVAILSTNEIHVVFPPAPNSTCFSGYLLELVKNKTSTLEIVQSKWIRKDEGINSHLFKLVRNGKYAVRINARSDCDDQGAVSLSPEVEFFSGYPPHSPVIDQEHEQEDVTKIAITGGLGSFVALILVSVLAVILKKKYKCIWKLFSEKLSTQVVSGSNNVEVESTIQYPSSPIGDVGLLANQDGFDDKPNEKIDDSVSINESDSDIHLTIVKQQLSDVYGSESGVDDPFLSEEKKHFFSSLFPPSPMSSETNITELSNGISTAFGMEKDSLPMGCRHGICVHCQCDNTVQYPRHAEDLAPINNMSHVTSRNKLVYAPSRCQKDTEDRNANIYEENESFLKEINFSQ